MKYIVVIVLFFLSFSANADNLVFVQGYMGQASNWSESGIIKKLEQNNWVHGGAYHYNSYGTVFEKTYFDEGVNHFFTVDLPTEAPLQVQAHLLAAYLKHLRQVSPDERLILAAHSAGGVLSRLVMVQNPKLRVDLLISIASPHLGSDLAELGSLVGETPLVAFAPLFGVGTLSRSQGLYNDLLPEKPGRFLYWLNRQPHPSAQYVSIIRNPNAEDGGDLVVPAYSHDMRNIEGLKNRANSYIVEGGHSLNPQDGLLIFDIINQQAIIL